MEFRAQFFAGLFGYAIWSGISLLFLQVVYSHVGAVSGWNQSEMWVLMGTFIALESLCYGLLGPNMWRFSGAVRDGTLDLALTKPVNTQFFVSTRYLDLNGLANIVIGIALLIFGLRELHHEPRVLAWLSWILLLGCGFVISYSLWFLCVTVSVWAVKLEAVAVIFDPMMQIARFPVDMYPQRARGFLTLVLPVAFLTTYPTRALLGQSTTSMLILAPLFALILLFASRLFFNFALRSYSSASS